MSVMAQLFLMSIVAAGVGAVYFHLAAKSSREKYGIPNETSSDHDNKSAVQ